MPEEQNGFLILTILTRYTCGKLVAATVKIFVCRKKLLLRRLAEAYGNRGVNRYELLACHSVSVIHNTYRGFGDFNSGLYAAVLTGAVYQKFELLVVLFDRLAPVEYRTAAVSMRCHYDNVVGRYTRIFQDARSYFFSNVCGNSARINRNESNGILAVVENGSS